MTDAPSSERPGPPPQVDPARDPLRRAFNWAGVLCVAAFFALGFESMGSVGTSPGGRLDSSRRTMSLLAALSFFVGAGCFTAASIRGAQLAERERVARLLALSAPALGRRATTPALSPTSSAWRPPSVSARTVALAALAVIGVVGLGFGVSVLARRQPIVAEVAIPAGTPDFAPALRLRPDGRPRQAREPRQTVLRWYPTQGSATLDLATLHDFPARQEQAGRGAAMRVRSARLAMRRAGAVRGLSATP